MVHAEAGATSLWVMTGTADAEALAEHCATIGKHLDVGERALSVDELRAAAPTVVMYVHEQQVGDIVVLPPLGAAQVRPNRAPACHITHACMPDREQGRQSSAIAHFASHARLVGSRARQ
jgi:hypothetical protein